jgi:hypothetical protein
MEPTDENPERPSTGDNMVIVDPQELLGHRNNLRDRLAGAGQTDFFMHKP